MTRICTCKTLCPNHVPESKGEWSLLKSIDENNSEVHKQTHFQVPKSNILICPADKFKMLKFSRAITPEAIRVDGKPRLKAAWALVNSVHFKTHVSMKFTFSFYATVRQRVKRRNIQTATIYTMYSI